MDVLAHGVGRVYESPIPVSLYFLGAALAVLVAFGVQAFAGRTPPPTLDRRLAGVRAARVLGRLLRVAGMVAMVLALLSGVMVDEGGLTLAPLLFWVGLVIGMTVMSCVVGDTWTAADPWLMLGSSRPTESHGERLRPPWWLGPLLVYVLFWFELVSGVAFDPAGVFVALLIYSAFALQIRVRVGGAWSNIDPFAILFGFASRIAPLRIGNDGLYYQGTGRLAPEGAMPAALFASVFVLLASTTLDNLRATVGWNQFLEATGLGSVPAMLIDSVSLFVFAGLFFLPFAGSVWIARRWAEDGVDVMGAAHRFGWSLVPIGIAYVLAHNAPLLITGVPQLLRALSDPFARGWNLFGTGDLWRGFAPSPQLVWFLEIIVIVGGHVLGVLSAHRIAVRLAGANAIRSQYALMGLMSIYTITTLWLLSQPLVV